MTKITPVIGQIDLTSLTVGDLIAIKQSLFEILCIQQEAESVMPRGAEIRSYQAFYLHDLSSTEMHPTHFLQWYEETRELFLSSLQYQHSLNELESIKEEKEVFSFKDKKTITLNDIRAAKIFTKRDR